ncbi:hypothetical protein BC940DRAFT_231244 [Gongronella butleri]|nr:hypothetical protein BC940DRAFT_231244 [Gongronella butleri]
MLVTRLAFGLGTIVALFGGVHATCSGDIEIKSQEDVDQLKTCRIFSGNVVVDQTGLMEFTLRGVELLEGNLIIHSNDGLQKVNMPHLQAINGQLRLTSNKVLHTLNMPMLSILRQFEMSVHPALKDLRFPMGLNQVDQFTVTDTTITRIEGLNMNRIRTLSVTNNIYLKQVSAANLTRVMGHITLSANSAALVADFNKIRELDVGTFRNLAGLGLKDLSMVTGDLSFISNSFEQLELPSLSRVAGTLTLSENIRLSKLSMPTLSHLGGALSLASNTELASINAFPKLEEVVGSLDIVGSFHEFDLPALADVRGGLNVQTSSDHFNCDSVNKLRNGVIKGNSFTCRARVSNPKSGRPGGANGKDLVFEDAATSLGRTWTMILFPALAFAYMVY